METTKVFYDTLICPKELKILKNCGHVMRTEENLNDLENILLKNS
jgi:hypothetical protein